MSDKQQDKKNTNKSVSTFQDVLDGKGDWMTDKRMPCRGCTPDCQNYDVCDGKPWRVDVGQ